MNKSLEHLISKSWLLKINKRIRTFSAQGKLMPEKISCKPIVYKSRQMLSYIYIVN
jgi:hypothetical protein